MDVNATHDDLPFSVTVLEKLEMFCLVRVRGGVPMGKTIVQSALLFVPSCELVDLGRLVTRRGWVPGNLPATGPPGIRSSQKQSMA